MGFPESLTTERLEIRVWTPDDVDALGIAVTESLEHLRPWMPWAAAEPLTRQARLQLIDSWRAEHASGANGGYGMFQNGTIVGACGLHRRAGPEVLEIGYWVHVDHIRRGLATEAARCLTDVAFEDPAIHAVEIHHDRANVASAGVPRSLGYHFAGDRPDQVTAPGEEGVDCIWRTTRADWFDHSHGSVQT